MKKHKFIFFTIISISLILLLNGLDSKCLANTDKDEIFSHGLAAITNHDLEYAILFKDELLKEAKEGKFTEPSHSMKIKQTLAMFRGYYYLEVKRIYPYLFSDDERKIIIDWFVRITERTFTREWSDFYYALAFWKPITAPYRNQENGTGALVVFAEIIKNKRPDLAKKAIDYVRNNAVMWKQNFRNTDDSISYQALWIYNCYNVARLLYPEWLNNGFSRKSFDWLKNQWPPDGSPLGYNPDPDVLVPDIMYLGSHLHKDGTYKWLGDKMMKYALDHNKELLGFRPGLVFKSNNIAPVKPTVGSLFMSGPGNLVQFPSENRPDKIVFREGWEQDDFYALLNLRFDGWHAYKGTNSFISIRYGEPFVVEDLVKKSWDWLPAGRAKRRDKNICRSRLNGFQLEGSIFRGVFNKVLGFEDTWKQDVPKFALVEDFISTKKVDFSRTIISKWCNWTNVRICLLVKGNYFIVCDFNSGKNKKKHAVSWHMRGKLSKSSNRMHFKQAKHDMSLFLCSDESEVTARSSNEPYPPEARDFAAQHDVWLQSFSDHSEMVSLFWPERGNHAVNVQKLEDSSPHTMVVRIDTRDFQDTVIIRDGRSDEALKYEDREFDSDVILLRKTREGTRVYFDKSIYNKDANFSLN